MQLTSEIHELGQRDIKQAQEVAWSAVGESGRNAFFQFRGRQSCIRKAMEKPLPGASADAFIRGATKVAGEVVREVVPAHIACLQAVESPLLNLVKQASETGKAGKDFSEEEQWCICYIFTQPPKELRRILKGGGADEIKKLAEAAIDENWNLAKINMVVLAVIEQFHRHIQTTVKFAAEVEGQVDKRFFQALAPKASTPLESAGS